MTCAIVDAYGAGRLLPAALRLRGVPFIHVRSEFPDTRLAYRPADFAVELAHTGDIAATAAAMRELGVTTVVAAAESGVLLADRLAAALGLPGNAIDHSVARRDKAAMQETIRAAGLAAARDFRSASSADTVAWVRDNGIRPVVLKPVLSAGTDNVITCTTAEEVVAAHDRIMASVDRYGRRNDTVLAQQFLRGSEYYLNTVSWAGTHRLIEVWRYHKRQVDGQAVYDYEDLLPLDAFGVAEVVGYARDVLDALGISHGAAHTEIMLTDDGPFLIETGARLGGGQVPELLSRCVGTDQVNTLAFALADPESFVAETDAPYQLKNLLRCVNLISPATGRMPDADGWDRVRELPSFAGLVANHAEGAPLTKTIDMATCPGTVYLCTDDQAELERDYQTLRDMELTGLYR
ncbi:ATP-grasp domain-containing protein [Actinokineospora enzanensis]|uniref:ATP-grasp domain-containing protein n=1 Tax=Actinokineospora enzanensis TaxID=155975 RepID=UPI0003649CA3|nr:ATP-grasp domain-containing protein [Actinokineospora enzanensis]